MNKFYKVFDKIQDSRILVDTRDELIKDRQEIREEYEEIFSDTHGYRCKSRQAKMGNKTLRIEAINQVLRDRTPEFYR